MSLRQPLPEILSDLGVAFRRGGEHHHVRPGWIGIECPYCAPAPGGFHMGISEDGKTAKCWRCGPHPPGLVIVAAAGLPRGQVGAVLARLPRGGPQTAVQAATGRYRPPAGAGPLGPAHRRYLRGRGFPPDAVTAAWDVAGYGPFAGRFAWRLFIPITYRGRPVSWTTRAIGADRSRYVGAAPEEEAYPAKKLLYGADRAAAAVIVHEGPTDVWRTGYGAVATLGTAVTTAQIAKIARYPVRALVFDSEPAAQRRAETLAAALAAYPGETLVIQLDAEDPATAAPAETRRLRRAVFGRK